MGRKTRIVKITLILHMHTIYLFRSTLEIRNLLGKLADQNNTSAH